MLGREDICETSDTSVNSKTPWIVVVHMLRLRGNWVNSSIPFHSYEAWKHSPRELISEQAKRIKHDDINEVLISSLFYPQFLLYCIYTIFISVLINLYQCMITLCNVSWSSIKKKKPFHSLQTLFLKSLKI